MKTIIFIAGIASAVAILALTLDSAIRMRKAFGKSECIAMIIQGVSLSAVCVLTALEALLHQ